MTASRPIERKASRTATFRYRLLGHDRVPLTRTQLEEMVRRGLLTLEAKVIRDGEGFASPIGSRPEFQHLIAESQPKPVGSS